MADEPMANEPTADDRTNDAYEPTVDSDGPTATDRTTDESTVADRTNDADDDPSSGISGSSLRSREVVVPLRLYKTVTVFTTLFSAILVVAGFVVLDTATNRARAPLGEVDPVLSVVGLAAIAGGGLLYAFASRFRAEGMGKDKDDADEPSDNG